jgi:hypothetical protein
MSKKFRLTILMIVIFSIVSLACSLPFNISNNTNNTNNTDNGGENPTAAPLLPGLTNPLAGTPDPNPVSFQAGIGSFDSYKLRIHFTTSDSSGATNDMNEVIESSIIDENNHSTTTSTSRAAGDTQDTVSTTESYTIGTVTCTLSDSKWEYSEKTIQDKEISDAMSQLIDFVPVFKNPEFVAKEDINGISTNHFTFKVAGIGNKSGANVTQNSGEYWLAVDGNYIVKYSLTLEIQSAPDGNNEAKTSTLQAGFNLYDVNVPVTLTKPAECVPPSN